ncbi:membrane hypothetical protein [Candidatus Magnetomoraceae bacterium gMMP-15]
MSYLFKKEFFYYWFLSLVSLMGVRIVSFSLSIQSYSEYHSITVYTLFYILIFLPNTLFAPFIGIIVDNYSKRKIFFISYSGTFIGVLLVLIFSRSDTFNIGIMLGILISSLFSFFFRPSLSAIAVENLKQEYQKKVGVFIQAILLIPEYIIPIMAVFLLSFMNVSNIVSLGTYLILLGFPLVFKKILNTPRSFNDQRENNIHKNSLSNWKDNVFEGYTYLYKKSFFSYILVMSFFLITLSFIETTAIPFFLELNSNKELNILIIISGVAILSGNIFFTFFTPPSRLALAVINMNILIGLILILGLKFIILLPGLRILCFIIFFLFGINFSLNNIIWQTKISVNYMGRVQAIIGMLFTFSIMCAYICSGPLIDWIIPLFNDNNFLFFLEGNIKQQNIIFFWWALGWLMVFVNASAYFFSSIRKI